MNLRPWITASVVTTALALFAAGRAEAQSGGQLVGSYAVNAYTGAVRSVNVFGTNGYVNTMPGQGNYAGGISGYVPPYSYYAAIPPMQPRTYVGYGNDQFPFYGRPYGHPYDRWTWEAMSAGNPLARYYYPPVR